MKITCLLLVALLISASVSDARDIKARTEEGQTVILRGNGTWSYDQTSNPSDLRMPGMYNKNPAATTVFKGKGKFSVWYNPGRWKLAESADISRASFQLINEDLYALAITERIAIPLETLKGIAIKNAREAAPDAKIIHEENRLVNGRNILCLKINGTIDGINFMYYGYYYAGDEGSFQLITYTSNNLFAEYEAGMTDFLNGFTVN